jgi:hypothetical protein
VLSTAADPDVEGGQTFRIIRLEVGDCILIEPGGGWRFLLGRGRGEAGARGCA